MEIEMTEQNDKIKPEKIQYYKNVLGNITVGELNSMSDKVYKLWIELYDSLVELNDEESDEDENDCTHELYIHSCDDSVWYKCKKCDIIL